MQTKELLPIGAWMPDTAPPAFTANDLLTVIPKIREPIHIIYDNYSRRLGLGRRGQILSINQHNNSTYPLMSTLPALYPEWLGDRSFLEVHHLRFPYIAGAMFRGITSSKMVIQMARAGMIGFFGAAGMSLPELEKSLNDIQSALRDSGLSWGSNLIYSPTEPELEEALVDLYLNRGVQRVSASAFMALSPSIVRYACAGLQTDQNGRILRKNYIFAKLSRPEIAKMFMSPAPKDILDHLASKGKITSMEASLASHIPIAEDITVEADSGGHTDNRPLTAIFPTILGIRDDVMIHNEYTRSIRVGAAGGIGTPSAIAAAFSMGAAYVLTGSINQSAIESGLSHEGRKMLALADVADVAMAPAADMFELGVKVQVLKRGTMFCNRAAQLYEIYSTYDSIEAIPSSIKLRLEKEIFKTSLEDIWSETHRFFMSRNTKEIEKAELDPKYRMALVFRWYLGNTGQWAIDGDPAHRVDYQICCGPSMGAFNAWVNGSFLSETENRTVVDIALNLLEGAAVVTRAQQLRTYGVPVPGLSFNYQPRPLY
ncbi:MAG: PfaD family polyunsaturated fatty acid/polyketide biosynthesis protein [Spirochaetota bacterium]|nr:PfaD family polyunsaturated fatty acid/polyketide biosynthesis protein [Spirochaetota bacterium]